MAGPGKWTERGRVINANCKMNLSPNNHKDPVFDTSRSLPPSGAAKDVVENGNGAEMGVVCYVTPHTHYCVTSNEAVSNATVVNEYPLAINAVEVTLVVTCCPPSVSRLTSHIPLLILHVCR
jgi:hypothetical protein